MYIQEVLDYIEEANNKGTETTWWHRLISILVVCLLNMIHYLMSCLRDFCLYLSLVVRKPVFGVSDQVRHKPGCTATEDG